MPYRFHPTLKSHVSGGQVICSSGASGGASCDGGNVQPVNDAADEQGSKFGAPGRCFLEFMSTYTMACLTSRGDRRARAWKRSSQTRPVRRSTRFTARATRIASPVSPRESELLSSASTSKCRWSACTEKCTRRNHALAVRPNARRISMKTTSRRKLGRRREARNAHGPGELYCARAERSE